MKSKITLEALFAKSAEALVKSQIELDQKAQESIAISDKNGIIPSHFHWARAKLQFQVRSESLGQRFSGGKTSLYVQPTNKSSAAIAIGIRTLIPINTQGRIADEKED